MGLFDKKFCDFCGNKIGLLGNKKLEDANMCKECASKLSPWFSERRHSTKADIDAQLQYREQNKSAVAAFSRHRRATASTNIIDENARKFMVTSASDIHAANPDVLDYSQALGCDLDVKESRNEIRRTDSTGKSVSYNPPRYEYSYDFHCTIRVSHQYFDEMTFSLSNGYIKTGEQPMGVMGGNGGWTVSHSGIGLHNNNIDKYYECMNMGNEIKAAIDMMRGAAPASAGNMPFNPNDPNSVAMALQQAQQQAMAAAQQNGLGAAGMGIGMVGAMAGMPMQQGYGMPQQGMPMQQYGQQPGMNAGMGMQQGMQQFGQQGMPQQYGQQPMQPQYGQPGMNAGMGMQQGMQQFGQQGMPQQYGQQYGQQPMQQPMQQPGMNGMGMGQAMGQGMAVGQQVTCPACQATTAIGPDGCCGFCGTKII